MTWELVDIHAGIDEDQREFMPRWAIWDTVTNTFLKSSIYGDQGWADLPEFLDSFRHNEGVRKRGARLFPKDED